MWLIYEKEEFVYVYACAILFIYIYRKLFWRLNKQMLRFHEKKTHVCKQRQEIQKNLMKVPRIEGVSILKEDYCMPSTSIKNTHQSISSS